MNKCFVIQPFDGGPFDARFHDVFTPAIQTCGLEPYRVDLDSNAQVPIEAIEAGIRDSLVCLADITTDNPNVWYELGFAFASNRPVVLVCSTERDSTKFPFDVRHRAIIRYKTGAPRDFDALKTQITDRLRAIIKSSEALGALTATEKVAPVDGVSASELAVLAAIASTTINPKEWANAYTVKGDVERSGFTTLAFNLGMRRLIARKFVEFEPVMDEYRGEEYDGCRLTTAGWIWVEENETKFLLQNPKSLNKDDIPF